MRSVHMPRAASLLLAALLYVPALGAQSSSRDSVQVAETTTARRGDVSINIPRWPGGTLEVSRENERRLDRALARYRTSYARLSRQDRARLHEAFGELVPGERLSRYSINQAQARAVVWLALDGEERGGWGDGRDDRDDRPRSCAATVDRISRDAGWIHGALSPLRRNASDRLSHEAELQVLEAVEERARAIAVAASRCTCPEARDKAGDLLEMARAAAAKHRESFVSAWMSLGDERIARMQGLAREVERAALGCER